MTASREGGRIGPFALRMAARAAVAYVAVAAVLYFRQSSFLFPAPKTWFKAAPDVTFTDLRIPVKDGAYVHGWWIPSASSAKTILLFHGNGYVLQQMVGGEVESLHAIGANLLLVDYRGYGSSTPLAPDEATILDDARAAFDYLIRVRGIGAGSIWLLGRSIGSGPATQLAVDNPAVGGLILESPFSSIDDAAVAVGYLRIFPVRPMLRTHFDNASKIGGVRAPVLIVAGTADTLTPPWMAEKLFAAAHGPKRLYLVQNAGHNDLVATGGNALTAALREAVGTPVP